jgi:hypothetical protein
LRRFDDLQAFDIPGKFVAAARQGPIMDKD